METTFLEPVDCQECGETYDEASGDGYCGLCPACADAWEREARNEDDPDEED